MMLIWLCWAGESHDRFSLAHAPALRVEAAFPVGSGRFQFGNAVGNLNTMVSLVDSLSAILRQQYRGSITIHPELKISSYLRIFGNLTMEEVESFIKDGEKAVWQDMNYIYNQTKVGQTLERCRRRVGKPGQWIDQTKAS